MDTTELYTQLQKKLKEKPAHTAPDVIKEHHQSYIDYHLATKPDEIYVIPMEEMAELSQHLSKIIRGKENAQNIGFLEELADVQICLDNLRMFCNIDADTFEYVKDIKFERAARKIKKGTA